VLPSPSLCRVTNFHTYTGRLRKGGHSEQLKKLVSVLQPSFYPVHLSELTHSTDFIPQDGGRFFLRNIGIHLQDYDMSQTKRPQSESATKLPTDCWSSVMHTLTAYSSDSYILKLFYIRTHQEPHHQGSNLGHSNLELVINQAQFIIHCFLNLFEWFWISLSILGNFCSTYKAYFIVKY
jgi:hypothetical protein